MHIIVIILKYFLEKRQNLCSVEVINKFNILFEKNVAEVGGSFEKTDYLM